MNQFLIYILVAACAASISFTVTMSGMFESMREWIYNKNEFFGQLITCPYCFGHYVVLVMLLTSNIPLLQVSSMDLYNALFTWFALMGIVALLHKVIITAYEPVMLLKAKRHVEKLKALKIKEQENNLKQ